MELYEVTDPFEGDRFYACAKCIEKPDGALWGFFNVFDPVEIDYEPRKLSLYSECPFCGEPEVIDRFDPAREWDFNDNGNGRRIKSNKPWDF